MSYEHSRFLLGNFEDHTTNIHDTINPPASGDVSGPATSTDESVPIWNGTDGSALRSTDILITNTGTILNALNIKSGLISDASNAASYIEFNDPDINVVSSGTITMNSEPVGDVLSPATSTVNAIATYAGTDGRILQNNSLTITGSELFNATFIGLSTSRCVEFNASYISLNSGPNVVVNSAKLTPDGGATSDLGDATNTWRDLYMDGKIDITNAYTGITIGNGAHAAQNTGNNNIALGINAGAALTGSTHTYYIGNSAGQYNIGSNNVGIGYQSILGVSGGSSNGNNNVGVGYQSLKAITGGDFNIGIGNYAGNTITTGNNNTCIGYNAQVKIDGTNQTAIGNGATCDTANQIVLGNVSVSMIRSGNNNGTLADRCDLGAPLYPFKDLYMTGKIDLTNAYTGITIGNGAHALQTGVASDNVAIGINAGAALTQETKTTYIGNSCGENNTIGTYNVGVGYQALQGASGANGTSNVGVGYQVGQNITTGSSNTLIGTIAGQTITTGSNNTCVGSSTNVSIGVNNQTAIGSSASCSGVNSTALGNGATTDAANQIVLGNASVTMIRPMAHSTSAITGAKLGDSTHRFQEFFCWNGTINTSDASKKTIEPVFDYGLDFVTKLNPIKYKWKEGGKRFHLGFAADEVGALIDKKQCDDFGGFIKPEPRERVLYDDDGKETERIKDYQPDMGLRYIEFIAPLVKAVQELSAELNLIKQKLSM